MTDEQWDDLVRRAGVERNMPIDEAIPRILRAAIEDVRRELGLPE